MKLSKEETQIFCEVITGGPDATQETLSQLVAPESAYNFRVNGKSIGRHSTENINIVPKPDGQGLDIYIAPNTKHETVHIPVAISVTGHKETVYNDFHIGENAEVIIIAGCGIYNCGGVDSVHDGIHRFDVGKGAHITYIEKHYGFGQGRGGKILNPTTEVHLKEGAIAHLELEQIKGVDSTIRNTVAKLEQNAKLTVKERLMTHGRQTAESSYDIRLEGKDSTADLESRSIAQDYSTQTFKSTITAIAKSRGHSACDAIIMDQAKVFALPALNAEIKDAELIHEAAIGKLASDQITKLMTLGLTQAQAESHIINGFLK
ncbi:SufD family Fe-S cluster assembly protein [Candidatus Saccharibacteria bacterium]|nr:SufD family Fe-S cluster assembly protein [Candidatus Saccharibacteria bacterium]